MINLEMLLSFAGTIIGLSVTILTFIVKTIKNTKAKKIAEAALKIGNAVLPFIREAEKFTSYSGAEKKEYVMTKANQFALASNISFDSEVVSEKVEELVALTKQVNIKSSSKEKAEMRKELEAVKAKKLWL